MLGVDYSVIAQDPTAFENQIVNDLLLASPSGTNKARFNVTGYLSGSVIVFFDILAGEPSPSFIFSTLKQQINDPNSMLRQGVYTKFVTGLVGVCSNGVLSDACADLTIDASSSSTNTGAIVGGVIGGVFGAALILVIIGCLVNRPGGKRKRPLIDNTGRAAALLEDDEYSRSRSRPGEIERVNIHFEVDEGSVVSSGHRSESELREQNRRTGQQPLSADSTFAGVVPQPQVTRGTPTPDTFEYSVSHSASMGNYDAYPERNQDPDVLVVHF